MAARVSAPRKHSHWRLFEHSERSERSEFDSGHKPEHHREPSALGPRARTHEPERVPAPSPPQPRQNNHRPHQFTTIRAAAPSKASFGDCRPFVMASKAASIAGKKRCISGMFGIGSPARAFSIVVRIAGSFDSSAK